ncbi:TPA: glycosyltransferase [Candidatus Scatousia excrementigallinarum]|uniref:Glycosyltransferase n=1 Tax=Candidatus Scatousia excrementigallinarum TaxID=2840935 RepID=A0A9D1F106_9BACT|nr:glycosyltransferase [Candidatus Scatousia excrementigallinarum]
MDPKVSIITTTYNIIDKDQTDDFYLQVNLLDKQTYPEIEHIVIDGASTDETDVLLKEYKTKGYINFFSEKDTSKVHAYNKGIMRAKGKYICFLSVDDFFHDITAIQDVVNLMEANQADFTFSPAYCRHPDGFVFMFQPAMHNAFQVMPCARQAMFFKRSVLEKENYFDEKFKILSEFDMIIRLMMKKYKGIYFDGNYTTYKLGERAFENPDKAMQECKSIFYKNYKHLTRLDDDILEYMVRDSEFPQELLEKLAGCYPPEDKELFFERCEAMHKLRIESQRG